MKNINYQQIYEDDITHSLRERLSWGDRFYELEHDQRLMIEELLEAGYNRALEDALDPDLLSETAALTTEVASQLQGVSKLIASYLGHSHFKDER
jgi:hypothetical protein